jgi:hypothetical protein
VGEIVALPEALQHLAASASAVGLQVTGTAGSLRTVLDPAADASPRQTAWALEQFLLRWGVALGDLGAGLETLGQLVETAARAYRDADGSLRP